jgi:predicted nucleic acid-binding protein
LACIRASTLARVPCAPLICASWRVAQAWGISLPTAAAFGVLAAAVKQAGRSPRPRFNDLWIAAQAIEHGYALLTLNAADFAGLPGLRLITLTPKLQS